LRLTNADKLESSKARKHTKLKNGFSFQHLDFFYRQNLFVVQFARSREAHPFGAAFGSRSGGCHAARMFVCGVAAL